MKALASRLVQAVLTLVGLSVLIFRLLTLMPGNAVEMMVTSNPGLRPEDVARLLRMRGLDQPWHVQYARWMWGYHDGLAPPVWHGPGAVNASAGTPWELDVLPLLDGKGPFTLRLIHGDATLKDGKLQATFTTAGVFPLMVGARDSRGLETVVQVDVSVDGDSTVAPASPFHLLAVGTRFGANASVDLAPHVRGADGEVFWRVVEGPGAVEGQVYRHTFTGPGMTTVVVEGLTKTQKCVGAFVVDHGMLEDPATFHPGFLWGDLGFSNTYKRPVAELLEGRLLATLRLTIPSLLLSVLLAILLGTLAARKPDSALDRVIQVLSNVGISVPVFWTGLLSIIVFAVTLQWLPPGGMETPGESGVVDAMEHAVLPVGVLTLFYTGRFLRYVRSGMVEVLQQDFIRTARALGLPEWRVMGYALRNALIPLVTVLALSIPGLFSGAVLTETVFSWPGMGRLIYESVLNSDHYVAMVAFLMSAAVVMLANLVADALYGVLDPRIRERP
jgi:peptide/nickel transport system permease protein